jgi:predicted Zn-dependent protease
MMRSRHPIASWILLVLLTAVLAAPRAGFGITIGEEDELSREMLRIIFKRFELVQDPYISGYVTRVGKRILSILPEQPFRYHFYVIKDASYNAFATPAGHIFVHTGLLEAMSQEEELAGILAHEISHVYCRHISQKIELSKKVGWASLAGAAASVLLGAAGGGAAAGAMIMGTQAAGATTQLAFSRDNEMQADQLGLKFMVEAGYNPEGLLVILKKIRGKQAWGKEQVPVYMMTHPAIEDRIVYVGTYIEDHSAQVKNLSLVSPAEFDRIQTRLIAEYETVNSELSALEAELKRDPANVLTRYRYGMVLARANRWEDAIVQLKEALSRRAFDGYLLRDLGKVYFLSGRLPQALSTLEGARLSIPNDADCLFFLGRTQQELGKLDEAIALYQSVILKMPDYREAYYFLGQSLGQQGSLPGAHYYLGMYHLRGYDYKTAAVQFKQALRNESDPEKRERIEQLLKQTENEIKAERKALE